MKICGIIAEYNPFHNGHARHIDETRHMLGAEAGIVCAMSGNYVQRGELAILEKYSRAQAAVCCGADLVLELPLSACVSSAEGFALGGVALLEALGCVTHLSFGSECGDAAAIRRAAEARALPAVTAVLRRALRDGLPYAAAMQQAVSHVNPDAGALYASPNNTLGIAYCAALRALKSGIEPLTILRVGAAHDAADTHDQLPSASHLRQLLTSHQADACHGLMPAPAYAVLTQALQESTAPIQTAALDLAILAHLRRLSPAELACFCGGEDGLEHRLFSAIRTNVKLTDICTAAQTKRYPLARIRRAVLRAWLGLPADLAVTPDYVRVLAIGTRGRAILRRMKKTCRLPVILKPIMEHRLPETLQPALRRDALADDLYALAIPDPAQRTAGGRYRRTPFLIP